MENPTNKGRASCIRFGDTMQAPVTTTALRIQHLTGRYALPFGTAAIVAVLAYGGSHGG